MAQPEDGSLDALFGRTWAAVQLALDDSTAPEPVTVEAPPGAAASGSGADAAATPRDAALALLTAAAKAVRVAALFSPNEEMDDVPTGTLRFLMLDFWRGALLQRCADMNARQRALRGARAALLGFLTRLQRLGALPKGEASLVGEDLIDEEDAVRHNAAEARAYRTGRARARMALEAGPAGAVDWGAPGEGAGEEDGVGSAAAARGGEEAARSAALGALSLAAMRAVDDLGFIAAELPLLAMRAAAEPAGAGADGRVGGAEARRQREREASRDAAFAPDRPGVVRFTRVAAPATITPRTPISAERAAPGA